MKCWNKKKKPKHTTKPRWHYYILDAKVLTMRYSFSNSRYVGVIDPLFGDIDRSMYKRRHIRKYVSSPIIANYNLCDKS